MFTLISFSQCLLDASAAALKEITYLTYLSIASTEFLQSKKVYSITLPRLYFASPISVPLQDLGRNFKKEWINGIRWLLATRKVFECTHPKNRSWNTLCQHQTAYVAVLMLLTFWVDNIYFYGYSFLNYLTIVNCNIFVFLIKSRKNSINRVIYGWVSFPMDVCNIRGAVRKSSSP